MTTITSLTGEQINTTSASWKCGGGELTITLLRNAQLSTNGWIPAADHAVQVKVGHNTHSFDSAIEHPQHGYCIKLDMGKITVRVPADQQFTVRAMLAELADHNATKMQVALKAEADYENHRAGVIAMLNQ